MPNLVSVVDRVVAVEVITVLGQHLWKHDVSLIPRSRIRSISRIKILKIKD